jgi:hypothetical protein
VCLRVRPGNVTAGYGQIRVPWLPPDLDYYINLMDLDVEDVAARYRALALETRARGTAMRAQAWCMPPADRDDAMPFPERYPDDDRSALEHRDNLHKCKTAMRRRLRLLALR